MGQGLSIQVAAGVAHGIYEMPLIGEPSAPVYPRGEVIVDANEGIQEVDLFEVSSSNVFHSLS